MNLPTMTSPEQACSLARQNHDHFYLDAFLMQVWLSNAAIDAIAHYAEKPNPADRHMQTGAALCAFHVTFPDLSSPKLLPFIHNLVRFSECHNPICLTLLKALAPVYIEHDLTGDYLGPKSPRFTDDPAKGFILIRRSLERLCEWLDAVIHLQTHSLWFASPDCFHPVVEKRRLAASDLAQPYIAQMSDTTSMRPYLEPAHSPRFKPLPESAPKHTPPGDWPFPKFDEYVISLWPLLKLHSWSAAELLEAISFARLPATAYPCQDPDALVAYCADSLGLHLPPVDHPDRHSATPGYDFVKRFLGPKRHKPEIGQAPWS
jgi:hypothetical protein